MRGAVHSRPPRAAATEPRRGTGTSTDPGTRTAAAVAAGGLAAAVKPRREAIWCVSARGPRLCAAVGLLRVAVDAPDSIFAVVIGLVTRWLAALARRKTSPLQSAAIPADGQL